ncbi:type-1 restriction enzyme EcoKI specificity protein [Spirochaetia bacterium]|nr:type-1 restriction enzyme EcoKI specificity protein [Spirochaetia bacterium]
MGNEHWVECKLGNVIKIKNGYAFKTSDFKKSGDIPIIKQTQLAGERIDLSNCVYVDKSFLRTQKDFILSKGDVLMGMSGSLGKFCIYDLDRPALQNQRIGKLVPISLKHLNNKYYWYYLNTTELLLKEKGKGLGVNNISADDIEDLPFPLPPINEQKRIVEKLDAILPKVKQAKEKLDNISGILKRFRQSVLAAACSGKLTEEWRERKDLPKWEESELFKVLAHKPTNGYSGKPVKYETKVKVLSLSATTSGHFDGRFFKYLDEEIPKDSSCWLKNNDILLQRGNTIEYVGVPAIYKGPDCKFIYPDLMIRLIAKSEKIVPEYLYYFFSWEKTRNFMRDNASGTAGSMPKINQTVLSQIIVNVPPVPEQEEIVRRVETLFTLSDVLTEKYQSTTNRVNKIEQAVLAKAFRGELAEADPDDEPAAALLKRILKERK